MHSYAPSNATFQAQIVLYQTIKQFRKNTIGISLLHSFDRQWLLLHFFNQGDLVLPKTIDRCSACLLFESLVTFFWSFLYHIHKVTGQAEWGRLSVDASFCLEMTQEMAKVYVKQLEKGKSLCESTRKNDHKRKKLIDQYLEYLKSKFK